MISARLPESYRRQLDSTAERYSQTLLGDLCSPAASYLAGRGIGPDIIGSFGLGVCDGSFGEHAQYAGMIAIPYRTPLGGVVSFKFRRPHDCTQLCEHSKYVGPYGARLYNTMDLDRADDQGYAFLTEGEIDAILLSVCGFPAVGCPGVEAWGGHPEWRCMLDGIPKLYVPFDRDEAGKRFAGTVGQSFGPGVAIPVDLPAADVGDAWRLLGPGEFRGWFAGVVGGAPALVVA